MLSFFTAGFCWYSRYVEKCHRNSLDLRFYGCITLMLRCKIIMLLSYCSMLSVGALLATADFFLSMFWIPGSNLLSLFMRYIRAGHMIFLIVKTLFCFFFNRCVRYKSLENNLYWGIRYLCYHRCRSRKVLSVPSFVARFCLHPVLPMCSDVVMWESPIFLILFDCFHWSPFLHNPRITIASLHLIFSKSILEAWIWVITCSSFLIIFSKYCLNLFTDYWCSFFLLLRSHPF